jgi:hypothetical protein
MSIAKATRAQQNCIDILTIECLFTRKERNKLMSIVAKREIKFPDELTLREADLVISMMKEIKRGELTREEIDDSDEE